MEKLNNDTTINFARSTNHNFHNLGALKQLIQKKNRIEYLQDTGNERKILTHKCSICKETGHNKWPCLNRPSIQTLYMQYHNVLHRYACMFT